jgi:RNA polymerase sigma-70 factor (ECF subfamily)
LRLVHDDDHASLVAEPLTFDAVYRQYSRHVAAIGLRLLGRDDAVDDLVQEVFVAALRGLHRVRDPGSVKGWLSIIAVRAARKRLRMRRLRYWIRGSTEEDLAAIDRVASAAASPEQRALLASVLRVLDGVPVAERVAWTLRVLEEEPLESVATLCGCSLATAKRRVAAARQHIDKELDRG